jgi:hypothetical protein
MAKQKKTQSESYEPAGAQHLAGERRTEDTAADAPAAVVLTGGRFWAGGRKFNTRLKAERHLELRIKN